MSAPRMSSKSSGGAWAEAGLPVPGTTSMRTCRAVKTVQQTAVGVDPAHAVPVGCAGKAERPGPDQGDISPSAEQHRRSTRQYSEQAELHRTHQAAALNDSCAAPDGECEVGLSQGICGRRAVQATRWFLTVKSTRSTAQTSAGVPRHRPQDTIAPIPITTNATAPRSAVGPQGVDQMAKPASSAPTA